MFDREIHFGARNKDVFVLVVDPVLRATFTVL